MSREPSTAFLFFKKTSNINALVPKSLYLYTIIYVFSILDEEIL